MKKVKKELLWKYLIYLYNMEYPVSSYFIQSISSYMEISNMGVFNLQTVFYTAISNMGIITYIQCHHTWEIISFNPYIEIYNVIV